MRRHIHRAKAFVSSLLKARKLFFFGTAVIAGLAIGIPAYIYFVPAKTNQLEEAIRQLRFIPITPPTTLRAPGTIYVVGGDGQVTSALCLADANLLKGIMNESPTQTQDAQSLRKASFAIDAKMEQSLKAQVKGDLIESVSFSLEKVSVLEVSIADLRVLAANLQKNSACADSIFDYLTAGQHVCQGQQVLKATTKYSIQTKRTVEGAVATQLRDAVRATIDPQASVDGSTVTSGEGLFYGMRLAPLCMSLLGRKLERPPLSFMDRIFNRIGM